MRVTNEQIRATLLRRVTLSQSRLLKLQEQAASGRRVFDPSDDPTATAMARRLDSALAELESYEPASRQVTSHLETADAVLGSTFDQLIRIQELTLNMANGSANDEDRLAAANEAEQIRMALVGLGNTKIEGEYLFGGIDSGNAPFLTDGTFVGSAIVPQVEISPGVFVDALPNGSEIFTAASGIDVLEVVEDIRDALTAGDEVALRGLLSGINQAQTQVRMGRARLGPVVNRVVAADDIRVNLTLQLTEKRGRTVDADLPETLSQLTLTSQSLDAALSVTARALSRTLLDKLN